MAERAVPTTVPPAGESIPWIFGSAWRLFATLAVTLAVVVGTLDWELDPQ